MTIYNFWSIILKDKMILGDFLGLGASNTILLRNHND